MGAISSRALGSENKKVLLYLVGDDSASPKLPESQFPIDKYIWLLLNRLRTAEESIIVGFAANIVDVNAARGVVNRPD